MTADDLLQNEEVRMYIRKADAVMEAIGYTEHGLRHVTLVSKRARDLLAALGYPERRQELAAMAGVVHDIGNICGRKDHEQSGAAIVLGLMSRLGIPPAQAADIAIAVGNHEAELMPAIDICAALIIADKSDVHTTRVRTLDQIPDDIHDRINDAAESSNLRVDPQKRIIALEIKIDTRKGSVMEYFEIFLHRMIMCRRAAEVLGCDFHLYINDTQLE